MMEEENNNSGPCKVSHCFHSYHIQAKCCLAICFRNIIQSNPNTGCFMMIEKKFELHTQA